MINMIDFCHPKDVNIITGNNNVGKSTILNAIRMQITLCIISIMTVLNMLMNASHLQ